MSQALVIYKDPKDSKQSTVKDVKDNVGGYIENK